MTRHPTKPITAETFWAKVTVGGPDECWPFNGHRINTNYGMFYIGGRFGFTQDKILAHRFSWFLTTGEDPAGLDVLHKCDNPPCCNPAHLSLGTHAMNMADSAAKGRSGQRGEKSYNSPLKEEDVLDIRWVWSQGAKQSDIARAYGIHASCISEIVHRKMWRHI